MSDIIVTSAFTMNEGSWAKKEGRKKVKIPDDYNRCSIPGTSVVVIYPKEFVYNSNTTNVVHCRSSEEIEEQLHMAQKETLCRPAVEADKQAAWRGNFDERQQKEISFCSLYKELFNHVTDGHILRVIIADMAAILDRRDDKVSNITCNKE